MLESVLTNIIDSLSEAETQVKRVVSGAFWTFVESRNGGISTTYRPTGCHSKPGGVVVRDCGRLTEKTTSDLAKYALSSDTLEASIGLAAINSAIEVDISRCVERNASEVLCEEGKGGRVGIIGAFPFISEVRIQVGEVKVFDLNSRPDTRPLAEMADWLPTCDAVCLSGTTLINKTFDDLMKRCANSCVVLTGPTAPLHPALLECGVDYICGSRVSDPELAAKLAMEGGTFRQFKHAGAVQLLTLHA